MNMEKRPFSCAALYRPKRADAATSALQDISILLEEKGLTISEEKTASMIKFSSLSAPTKIEELTAGSDEKKKNTAQPRRESNPGSCEC